MILQRVTPVTHSIGNCLKRVIVIIASVIVFKNAMSTQNMIGETFKLLLELIEMIGIYLLLLSSKSQQVVCTGTGVALFGVFCYSQAKRMGKKKQA